MVINNMTLEQFYYYNETIGMTIEINDGKIVGANIEGLKNGK